MLLRDAVASEPTAPEQEIMLRALATREVRAANEERLRELAQRVDPDVLAVTLAGQGLLELVGSRLLELGTDELEGDFRGYVRAAVDQTRRMSARHQLLTVTLIRKLAESGIHSMAIKGVFMAESLHGDPALRASSDIDLLVDRSKLDEAVASLLPLGYTMAGDALTPDGLPELHQTLEPKGGTNVEVHWRVHWNERGFARDLLARAAPDPWRGGIPTADDELAILLISFAKDAFIGLRYAADVAAWWDQHGESDGEAPLADTLRAHPELRSPILAAARVVERLAGVPALALHGHARRPTLRARLAVRLADPIAQRSFEQLGSEISLADLLLSPWRRIPSVLRRHREISHTHGLRVRTNGESGGFVTLRYDIEGILKLIPRFFAIWGRMVRGPVSRPLDQQSPASTSPELPAAPAVMAGEPRS